MNKVWKRLFCPAARDWINFIGEDADSNRDRDSFGIEKSDCAPILPIETGSRDECIRQPGDRDVVENVVTR